MHKHQHVLRIFGTKGTFIHDDAGPRFHTALDPAIRAARITLPTLPENKGALIPAFVTAIREDEDLNKHTQDIFDVVSICAACEKALQTNSTVEVEYL